MGERIMIRDRILVDGRFEVRVIDKNGSYGRDDCLIHDKDDALVEFWDIKYNQFVSRYYKSTLLERTANIGLSLHGDIPAWAVSAEGMEEVRTFLLTR